MCLICIEYEKQKMTIREAWRAYGEMAPGMDPQHAREVKKMLEEEEEKERQTTTNSSKP